MSKNANNEELITLQYAIKPTLAQEKQLYSHAGAVRYAYNYTLNLIQTNYQQRKQNPTLEIIPINYYKIRKIWNQDKHELAPWWSQNSKEAYNTGINNATKAYENFFEHRTDHPKYHSRKESTSEGITFTTATRRLDDLNHFTIPNIGSLKLYEKAHKLSWLLNKESSHITNVTVKYSRTRWHLSINVRVSENVYREYHLRRTKHDKKRVTGVDLGLKNTAIFSDGTVIPNPKHYDKQLRKLRKQQKALARKRKVHEQQGIESKTSKRYAKAKKNLRKTYAKITNQEIDYAHKLSKQLVDEYSIICLETLNVIGLVRNRKLSRHIQYSNWGRLVEFLTYKAQWYNSVIVRIDRFYPSSKKCSNTKCGQVKTKLDLSERTYTCEYCGLTLDRDVNAAINIREEGLRVLLSLVAQSYGDTLNGHGETSAGLDYINDLSETGFSELLSEYNTYSQSS